MADASITNSTVSPLNGADYFGINAAKPKSELDMKAFLRLLTVQLENQNPLEPMNDRDFFAQMAQLGQVQGTDNMIKSLNVAQASSLMGKHVTALRGMTESGSTGENQIVSGTVKRLTVRNGEYYLGVQEANGGIADVKMSGIQSVTE